MVEATLACEKSKFAHDRGAMKAQNHRAPAKRDSRNQQQIEVVVSAAFMLAVTGVKSRSRECFSAAQAPPSLHPTRVGSAIKTAVADLGSFLTNRAAAVKFSISQFHPTQSEAKVQN